VRQKFSCCVGRSTLQHVKWLASLFGFRWWWKLHRPCNLQATTSTYWRIAIICKSATHLAKSTKAIPNCWMFYALVGKGPKWINSHQCTSWPFCPLDGLRFFIRRRMGLITVDFFLLLTTALFFFFLFLAVFPGPDLTHSYPAHFPTFISIAPTYWHNYPNN
jgi:hypothetical protein